MKEVRTYSPDKDLVTTRRNQLVNATCKLFLKQGFDRTSMKDVAKAINMTKGGLYHYIGNKDDLIQLILAYTTEARTKYFDDISKKIARSNPTKALQKAMKLYYKSVDEEQDFYNVINHIVPNIGKNERQFVFDSESTIITYFEKMIKEGIKSGEFRKHDPKLTALNIVTSGHAWANMRWYLRKHYSIDRYIKEQCNFVMTAIRVCTSDIPSRS